LITQLLWLVVRQFDNHNCRSMVTIECGKALITESSAVAPDARVLLRFVIAKNWLVALTAEFRLVDFQQPALPHSVRQSRVIPKVTHYSSACDIKLTGTAFPFGASWGSIAPEPFRIAFGSLPRRLSALQISSHS
jgi:hypothetical protein